MEIPKDLIAASATPLLLSILEGGDSYGYAIIKRVKELSDEQISWSEGMLYPVLHRLEDQNLISSHWKGSSGSRRRRYYRITAEGRRAQSVLRRQWLVVNETLLKTWLDALTIPCPVLAPA